MDFKILGEKLVSHAQKKGANETEIFITERIKNTIRVHKGDTESVKSSKEKGLGIRVFIDNKLGFGYTSCFDEPHLLLLVEKTVSLAQETDPDEGNVLPETENKGQKSEASVIPCIFNRGQESGEQTDLDIFDQELEAVTLEEKIKKLKQAEKFGYEQDKRITNTELASYQDTQESNYLINSKGLNKSFKATETALVFSFVATQDNSSQTGWDFSLSRFYNKLESESSVKKATDQAISLLGSQKIASTKASAVFSPYAAAEFISIIAQALNADDCQKGRSFLKDSIGKEIAEANVNIIDDGRLKDGFLSVPMDGEGIPTKRKVILEKGVLKTFLHSTYTATKEKISSTGNAFRESYKSIPGISPSNFYLEKGFIPETELIKKIDKGIYIIQTLNVGGINTISGEYSVGASGIWIENGELTYPVREVTIASFLPVMLKNIVAIANNLRFVPVGHSSVCGSPSFQISEVAIGGK